MLGALASLFGLLGILTPCLLEEKLVLQKVIILGLNIQRIFSKAGVNVMGSFADSSIPRYCFLNGPVIEDNENVAYLLHGFL